MSTYAYALGERVLVPFAKGAHGVVSLPFGKADGEVDLQCWNKADKGALEGFIYFVVWVGEDGSRQCRYFTEMCLSMWAHSVAA